MWKLEGGRIGQSLAMTTFFVQQQYKSYPSRHNCDLGLKHSIIAVEQAVPHQRASIS
jgi:hypothetical protein